MKRIAASCKRALQYMRSQQRADGAWNDYQLPVGHSDAWVTAIAAAATSEALHALDECADARCDAKGSVACAIDWLQAHQAESGGWGFNGNVEQDADTTAWAVLALRYGGHEPSGVALSFLQRHACPDGGFKTFLKSDAWGDHHVDVSPTVARALWDDMTSDQRRRIAQALSSRSVAGRWHSYWWRSSHYATAGVAEANRALGLGLRPEIHITEDSTNALNSNLDVACALITAVSADIDSRVIGYLTMHLIATQTEDGGWRGSDDLRVTDPECHEPWRDPVGRRYEDLAGILTTAFCMRALSLQTQ